MIGDGGKDDAGVTVAEDVIDGTLEGLGTLFGNRGDFGAVDDDSGWVPTKGEGDGGLDGFPESLVE